VTKPLPGDTVCCRVNAGHIVYSYVDKYETIENFEVISVLEGGYLVKVPVRLFLSNSFWTTQANSKEYSIPQNFMGVNAHFITDGHVCGIKSRKDGECCDRCKEFFPMASRHLDGSFKCFLCRIYRFR
jgi:hypothetical protein